MPVCNIMHAAANEVAGDRYIHHTQRLRIHTKSGSLIISSWDSLVKQLKAWLAHTHFLLYAKLRNGGVLRRTLSTENLATGSTMVLEKQRTQIVANVRIYIYSTHTAVNE